MAILLPFAPFLVFVVVERLAAGTMSLSAAAATSALLMLRDFTRGRKPKILEAGTLILFAGLALYAAWKHPAWSMIAVRLHVDAGLLLVVLASLV